MYNPTKRATNTGHLELPDDSFESGKPTQGGRIKAVHRAVERAGGTSVPQERSEAYGDEFAMKITAVSYGTWCLFEHRKLKLS